MEIFNSRSSFLTELLLGFFLLISHKKIIIFKLRRKSLLHYDNYSSYMEVFHISSFSLFDVLFFSFRVDVVLLGVAALVSPWWFLPET